MPNNATDRFVVPGDIRILRYAGDAVLVVGRTTFSDSWLVVGAGIGTYEELELRLTEGALIARGNMQ